MKNLSEELPRLEINHNKLGNFFKPLGIDRSYYERNQFIDAAIRYIEPINLGDEFKELLEYRFPRKKLSGGEWMN